MEKIQAAITGVHCSLPEDELTNKDLEQMVETNDEWITSRTGIKTRRILKGEGKGTSDMGGDAVKKLLEKKDIDPGEIDLVICATVTPDYPFPATANLISNKAGIKNAWSYDLNAACSGFLYALETGAKFIGSGQYKKVIVVGADKMSAIVDYTDRATCIIFGDAAGAVLLEPNEEGLGVVDSILRTDGDGKDYLYQAAGGSVLPASHETVDNHQHFIYQDGRTVFKIAVTKMADISVEMMEKHGLTSDDVDWLVPHQANLRIIEATANRMNLDPSKVMINIQRYGNTTAATIPLCLWEWEDQLKKGDRLILSAFGGGFTWGATYIKWAYGG